MCALKPFVHVNGDELFTVRQHRTGDFCKRLGPGEYLEACVHAHGVLCFNEEKHFLGFLRK